MAITKRLDNYEHIPGKKTLIFTKLPPNKLEKLLKEYEYQSN